VTRGRTRAERALASRRGRHVVSGRWMWGAHRPLPVDHGGHDHRRRCLPPHVFPAGTSSSSTPGTPMGCGARRARLRRAPSIRPDGRSVQPGVSRPQAPGPLAAFPNFTLLASGVAAATLASPARHRRGDRAGPGKTPLFSSRTLAQSSAAQGDIARAEATLGAARAFLLDELATGVDVALAGDRVEVASAPASGSPAATPRRRRRRPWISPTTWAEDRRCSPPTSCSAASATCTTATQHLMVSPRTAETVGKLLLGVEADTSTL